MRGSEAGAIHCSWGAEIPLHSFIKEELIKSPCVYRCGNADSGHHGSGSGSCMRGGLRSAENCTEAKLLKIGNLKCSLQSGLTLAEETAQSQLKERD